MLSGNKQRVEVTLVKERTIGNLKSFLYPFGVTPMSEEQSGQKFQLDSSSMTSWLVRFVFGFVWGAFLFVWGRGEVEYGCILVGCWFFPFDIVLVGV